MRASRKGLIAGVAAVAAAAVLTPLAVSALGSKGAPGVGGTPAGVVAPARPAAPVTGTCKTTKTDFAATDLTFSSTTSTAFVNIPEASVSFQQGGASPSCAIVMYSAEVFAAADSTALMYVRALLDGVTAATPAQTQFSGDDDEDGDGRWARSHAMNFVFPSVSPGGHTITMQFRSSDGGAVFTHQHTTLVEHR